MMSACTTLTNLHMTAITPSYLLGLLFLLLVSILWTLCSIIVQHVYHDLSFHSPFLVVYIGTSLFSIFLPMRWAYETFGPTVYGKFGGFGGREVVRIPWKTTGGGGWSSFVRGGLNGDYDYGNVDNNDVMECRHENGHGTHDWNGYDNNNHDHFDRVGGNDDDGDGDNIDDENDSRKGGDHFAEIEENLDNSHSFTPTGYQNGIEMNHFDNEPSHTSNAALSKNDSNTTRPPASNPHSSSHSSHPSHASYLLTHQDHISISLRIAPLWFLSNYFYAQSLEWTSIANSTILASMGSLFAFGFATCSCSCWGICGVCGVCGMGGGERIGDEKVTKGKLLGVALCFLGGVCTAWGDVDLNSGGDDTVGNNAASDRAMGSMGDVNGGDGSFHYFGAGDWRELNYLRQPHAQHVQHLENLQHLQHIRHLLPQPNLHPFQMTDSSLQSLYGDLAGLLSAIGYGAYTVLLRHLCPKDEARMSMQLVFGYIGLLNMVCLSPIAVWVWWTGLENGKESLVRSEGDLGDFDSVNEFGDASPSSETTDSTINSEEDHGQSTQSTLTWSIFLFLLLKGLLDNVLSDYLWARAVILTSATVASVGVGLTIPMAFVADWIMGNYSGNGGNGGNGGGASSGDIAGAVLVILGFLFVNIDTCQKEDVHRDGFDGVEEDEDMDDYEENGMDAESVSDVEIIS